MIYYSHLNKYLVDWIKSRIDFSNRIPDKFMKKEPLPNGLYGYTLLGHNQMVINNNLNYEQDQKTQLHECIHTNDEYETRRLTDWMREMVNKVDEMFSDKYSVKFKNTHQKFNPK